MDFKAKVNVNVKTPSGDFVVLKKDETVELPAHYVNHPQLEPIVSKKKVASKTTVKKVAKKATKKTSKK